MKISIKENNEKVGWYDAKNDEYEYDGKYSTVESILESTSGFTSLEVDIDDDLVGGEKWTPAEEKEKIRQLESLLQTYQDVSIQKSSLQLLEVNDGVISKRKVYVDGPNDGPEWADVQESEHNDDVYYYETRSRNENGEIVTDENGIPADLDPEGGERYGIRLSDDDQSGRYADSMDVVEFEDGRSVYVKQAEPGHMISIAMSDTILNSLGSNAPKTAYDPEGSVSNIDSGSGAVYSEGIDGQTIGQITGSAYNLPGMGNNYDRDKLDPDSFLESVAGMIITGNDDLNAGNLIADKEGDFWIIDNDNLGERNMMYDPQEAKYIADSAKSYANSLGIDFDFDSLEQKMQEMALSVWDEEEGAVTDVFLDSLEQAADHGIEDDPRNSTEAIKENILMNIDTIANGNIDLGGTF